MKLLSREQIETLSKFKSENYLTTSFYLDTDKSKMTKKEITLSLKNLLSTGKSQLDKLDISKAKKESLTKDLDQISLDCSKNLSSYNFAGLAIFSCSKQDFWQFFSLPKSPRSRVILDQNPYVRPLSAILNEYHRICVLTLERREAKWYDIFMGEISLLDRIAGDVPGKVKEGGWEGYESKRIERHIATLLRDFLKKTAKKTFELFKKDNFDWLILGCKDDRLLDIENFLHPYLKSRLQCRFKANSGDSPNKILKEVLKLEINLKKQEQEKTIQNYVSELEKGGLAISGLKNTLRSLNRGEVQTFLITRSFSKPGRTCPRCHFLFVDELRCPSCERKTEIVMDVIDEAVEAAMDKKCQVRHINGPSKLNRYGNIGALLRYKT